MEAGMLYISRQFFPGSTRSNVCESGSIVQCCKREIGSDYIYISPGLDHHMELSRLGRGLLVYFCMCQPW